MKLVFPNGECDQAQLKPGKNLIGSDDGCQVVLKLNGIADHHAEIHLSDTGALIGVQDATNITRVNGKLVAARTPIKSGDALLFGTVQAQVVGGPVAAPGAPPPRKPKPPPADAGQTVVRAAIPKFILRGVSGSTFGKNFPLHGSTVIGRNSDCDIPVSTDEVSRRHAQVIVTRDGLYVEDLGSANGTYVNGEKITKSKLNAGDELRIDTERFLVQVPGMEVKPTGKETAERIAVPADEEKSSSVLKWVILAIVVLAGAIIGLKLGNII